jgi:hypothetical protein
MESSVTHGAMRLASSGHRHSQPLAFPKQTPVGQPVSVDRPASVDPSGRSPRQHFLGQLGTNGGGTSGHSKMLLAASAAVRH